MKFILPWTPCTKTFSEIKPADKKQRVFEYARVDFLGVNYKSRVSMSERGPRCMYQCNFRQYPASHAKS